MDESRLLEKVSCCIKIFFLFSSFSSDERLTFIIDVCMYMNRFVFT